MLHCVVLLFVQLCICIFASNEILLRRFLCCGMTTKMYRNVYKYLMYQGSNVTYVRVSGKWNIISRTETQMCLCVHRTQVQFLFQTSQTDLVSLKSSSKMLQNGIYFMLISWILSELPEFQIGKFIYFCEILSVFSYFLDDLYWHIVHK